MIIRKISIDLPFLLNRVRLCSTNMKNLNGFVYEPKYTISEQEKILTVINKCNKDQLASFDVSMQRIKSLEIYKTKKGPFKSLNDVLEVEGLGVKVLEKLCQSIILNNFCVGSKEEKTVSSTSSKGKRSLLTPPLPLEMFQKLNTAIGLHLDPTGISWAKYSCNERKIEEWDFFGFNTLPNKMLPTETFDLGIQILNKLPIADVYILEATQHISPQQNNANITLSFNHQQELLSMLLASINTSPIHNLSLITSKSSISCENKVFFLRSKAPARLFKTLVGNEKVSATAIINSLIENSEDFNLSCSRVNFDEKLKEMYKNKSSADKDKLGQSLMLVISFIDLCILKNPVSLKTIAPGNRKK